MSCLVHGTYLGIVNKFKSENINLLIIPIFYQKSLNHFIIFNFQNKDIEQHTCLQNQTT